MQGAEPGAALPIACAGRLDMRGFHGAPRSASLRIVLSSARDIAQASTALNLAALRRNAETS